MRMLLAIAAMLIVQPILAKEEKTVAVVERTTSLGIEQVGFSFVNNKIDITINSNFLTKSLPYHFGAYEITNAPDIFKKIKSLSKVKKTNGKEIYLSPHDMTVYVNGNRVAANSNQFGEVLALVKTIFESKKLSLIDGITVLKTSDIKKYLVKKKRIGFVFLNLDICTSKYATYNNFNFHFDIL